MNELAYQHAFVQAAPYHLPVRLYQRNIINTRTIHGTRVRNGAPGAGLRRDVDAMSEPTPLLCQRGTAGPGTTLPGRVTIRESPAPRPVLNRHSGTTGERCRCHG